MRVKRTYDWRLQGTSYSVHEATEISCSGDSEGGVIQRVRASIEETKELLGRLVETLVDGGVISPEQLLNVLGGGFEAAED